jgi:MOSC domain-containing protein YiiM
MSFAGRAGLAGLMKIEAIYLSPGHNYFGRYGQAAGEHPIVPVPDVECVAGWGLKGDRFYGYRPDYDGQVTFFAMETFEALCAELNCPGKSPSATRRNVFTRGADLNALIGTEFVVQGVRFRGMKECRPCFWMNQAFAAGAEDWLKGRGGLRARVLVSGTLKVDAAPC